MREFFEMPGAERRYRKNISKKRSCFSKIPRDSCEFSKSSCYSTGLGSRGEIVHEQPIVVDLTNDEAKLTRKERETSASSSEDYDMIADSSSRFHRDNNSNNVIATALRDRGSCVIPVQPNHCLPIHPAPPVPTRAVPILKSRKSRSPVLKLVRASILDVVNVEPAKSTILEANGCPEDKKSATFFLEQNREQKTSSEKTNSVLQTNRNSCSIKIVDRLKRKITDEKSKERGKDLTKDSLKKRRKSSDINSDGGFNELFTNSTANIDKEGKTELCNDKKCTMSIVGSTTEINFGKEKIVPPLRLKKVVQEGKDGDRGNPEVPLNGDKETNYRIVTGATPRPESQSTPTICEYWTRENFDNDDNFDVALTSSTTHNVVHRSSVKSDNYKLKYRRNRLKRKLKELQDKALNLSQEIANAPNIMNSSPQRNTRLRQMMNCYEKQIENVSKLLNKLYNENPLTNKFVDIDENKREHQWDDEFVPNFSPISSPEPPKLSPRSPIGYHYKSPDSVRSSPPVLPKVSLNISSNLDILDDAETVQLTNESTWITCENNAAEISSMTDTFCEETTNHEWESNNNTNAGHRLTTSPILSSTSIDPCSSENVENIKNGEVFFNNNGEIVEKDKIKIMHGKKETMKEFSKTIEVVSSNHSIIEEMKEIRKQDIHDADRAIQINIKNPIISSITGGSEVPHNVRCDQIDTTLPTPSITKTQMSSSIDMMNILQLGSNYDSTLLKKNVSETSKMEDSKKIQKVPSSTTQSRKTNYDSIASTFNQVEYPFTDQHFPTQSSNDNRIITEQFPTLGNWVAKMSKKQVSKQKSKLHTVENTISTISMEEPTRTSKFDTHKLSLNETNTANGNNVLNITSQWNKERWHRQHHQQHQQQQLFQHMSTGTTPLSLPSTTTLNSGICTPLSTTQFYPSNYNINPYSGATFGYHSALYPVYNGYPYHSRLHPGTPLTSYHIPMQDPLNSPLRPLSHVDKHLSSLQNPNRNFTSDILKYSGSLPAARFQSPNDFGFDRLRTSTSNHNSEANCLSSLLLASSSLSSGTQQTLPRTSLSGYSASNNQYGRSRIIPDVVAAAAAAAVVAAASIGRQRASLPSYNKSASTGINAVMEMDPTRLTSNTTNNHTREHLLSNQGQSIDVGMKEPQWNSAGYHSIPNLLLEKLPFVRTEHNFPTTSTLCNNIQDSPSISTVSFPQISKKVSRSIERDCETPHLGKVNRSPDTLSNLKCSNCGVGGSMFKCLGCEVAFYCNERCQTRHWSIHVERCPKKMPKLKKVA
ncbi:uncharacterized protein LOC118450751 isoform X1 [Vespa mandarinia]|uniref:uncharacterized protein LOC118450751 isoform X1 n=2 Tax=Vespa mandarinia TaxID=7446 RepID=UPI00161BFDEF|nr:uncharacterized protein LOC118450751 isoform X1 [Vespa mandarinia]